MTWLKVDDKLHDHRKTRKAGKAAMGVWVLSGSWSTDNETDGFIPAEVLPRWGNKSDANRLVSAGLWHEEVVEGEQGWRFHDWSHFQPSAAVTAAKRAAEHAAGLRGNHKRWHADREITDPDCEYCHRVPDGEPDPVPDADPIGGGESAPIPPVPVPEPEVSSNEETRLDVERICTHLADRIEANGCKRPTTTTKAWRDAARLLMDLDGRSEDEVHKAIDWCQASEFWRANVMSMSKLREKFDQMRLQAQARPASSNVRQFPGKQTKPDTYLPTWEDRDAAGPPPDDVDEYREWYRRLHSGPTA